MGELITLAILATFAALGLGSLGYSLLERAYWRRMAVEVLTRHPMNTTPPTVTELPDPAPEWATPREG